MTLEIIQSSNFQSLFIRALGFWGSTLGKKEVNWTELQALFSALTRAIPGLSVLYIGAYIRSYLEKTKQNKKTCSTSERDRQKETECIRQNKERKKRERRKRPRKGERKKERRKG